MSFEANLWKWLREQARPLIAAKKLHICRVENWVTPGYPDVEGCLSGRGFHLELKGTLRPARPATRVTTKFQPGQKPWLKRRWAAGGSCFVLLRVGVGREVKRYLFRGDQLSTVGEVPESELNRISLIHPKANGLEVIKCAANYREETGA